MQEEGRRSEVPVDTADEVFGDEKLSEGKSPNALTLAEESGKKRKKKKKKKKKQETRENDHTGRDVRMQMPQLAYNSTSPKENLSLHVVGESAMTGPFEGFLTGGEATVKNVPMPKRSRKTNAITSKKTQAGGLKAAGAITRMEGEKSHDASDVSYGARSAASSNHIKPTEVDETAWIAELAKSKTATHLHADTFIQDASVSISPRPYQGDNKAMRSCNDRLCDTQTTTQANGRSTTIGAEGLTHQPEPIAHFEHHSQEKDLSDLSSRIPRNRRFIPHPMADYGDEEEEEEPKPPSRKSLGKRKASDEPIHPNPYKKKKIRKGKPLGQDLRTFGFLPTEERSHSHESSSGSAPSTQSPNLLSDIAGKVWEENNRISQEPELPLDSQTSLGSPRSSWNAVNNSMEPEIQAESSQSLFVPEEESLVGPEPVTAAAKIGDEKRSFPVVEILPINSTPSAMTLPATARYISKTPKAPAGKNMQRAPSTYKGKLQTEQLDALSAAVESYRALYELTEFQLNDRIHADAKDKFAQQMWKDICEEVPDIPRRTVMNTCRRKFYNFHRGSWTEDEDNELKTAHEKHPGKWKMIGEILNRFPEDVRDRWRNYLVCGDMLRKDTWEFDEEKQLRVAIKQCIEETRKKSRFGDTHILDGKSLIDWGKVSELMGRTRSRIQCRDKWVKLKEREAADMYGVVSDMPISETWRLDAAALEARLFSAEEKLLLLRAIRDSGAAREGKIPWQTLKIELHGRGKRMAWRYCFRKLQDHVPNHKRMNFQEIVSYLIAAFEKAFPNEPNGFDLHIEDFALSQTLTRRTESRKHVTQDDQEPPSTSSMRKMRRRKTGQDKDDKYSDAEPVLRARRPRLRDRMLKEGDSLKAATSLGGIVSADVVEDVTQGFESIKRTPKSNGKLAIRRSRRNQLLSEEKVIEDPSDDEQPVVNGLNSDGMDSGHNESDDTTNDSAAEDQVLKSDMNGSNSDEMDLDQSECDDASFDSAVEDDLRDSEKSDVKGSHGDEMDLGHGESGQASGESIAVDEFSNEEYHEQCNDEDDYEMRRATEGSPDLDTPVRGRSFKRKLGSALQFNGFQDGGNGAMSSDDEMSDIAVRQARVQSVEL